MDNDHDVIRPRLTNQTTLRLYRGCGSNKYSIAEHHTRNSLNLCSSSTCHFPFHKCNQVIFQDIL